MPTVTIDGEQYVPASQFMHSGKCYYKMWYEKNRDELHNLQAVNKAAKREIDTLRAELKQAQAELAAIKVQPVVTDGVLELPEREFSCAKEVKISRGEILIREKPHGNLSCRVSQEDVADFIAFLQAATEPKPEPFEIKDGELGLYELENGVKLRHDGDRYYMGHNCFGMHSLDDKEFWWYQSNGTHSKQPRIVKYLGPAVKWREPVLPQDINKPAQFSDYETEWFDGTLGGITFVIREQEAKWLMLGGGTYKHARVRE